jgi:hypothetical protein
MKNPIILVVVVLAIGAAFYLFNQSDNSIIPINTLGNGGIENPVAGGECYVGGCSSQICSDEPGIVSTCEFREEYACYQTATCERQPDGECGWTPTSELQACIDNAQ